MANNCLVKKLKGIVDSDTNMYLDEIRMVVDKSIAVQDYLILGSDGTGVTVKSLNGKTFTLNGTTGTEGVLINGWQPIENIQDGAVLSIKPLIGLTRFAVGNARVDIGALAQTDTLRWFNVYSANQFEGVIGDIECFKHSNMEEVLGSGTSTLTGDIKWLANSTRLTIVRLNRPNAIYGDVSVFRNCPNLTEVDLAGQGITGTLTDFGGCTALTKLTLGTTRVNGSIEDFVAAQRTAGRTTASGINTKYLGTGGVTFNGSTAVSTDAGEVLSWTSNTITFNGVTINA